MLKFSNVLYMRSVMENCPRHNSIFKHQIITSQLMLMGRHLQKCVTLMNCNLMFELTYLVGLLRLPNIGPTKYTICLRYGSCNADFK